MNLADKIRSMSEMVNEEAIAKALSIPIEVVRGFLNGNIPDVVLEQFDPARPPDIRIVQQKKIVRSMVIGVVSFGYSGATTLVSSMATLTAQLTNSSTVAVDFNEYSGLGAAMGIEGKRELIPTLNGWALSNDIQDNLYHSPNTDNLSMLLGATSLTDYMQIPSKKLSAALDLLGLTQEYVFVDCPHSPGLWSTVFPHCDFIIYVLKPETVELANLIHIFKADTDFSPDKYGVVLSDAVDTGSNLALRDAQRFLKDSLGLQILGILPQDKSVRKSCNAIKNHVLAEPHSVYTQAVKELLKALIPGMGKSPKQRANVFGKLFGGI